MCGAEWYTVTYTISQYLLGLSKIDRYGQTISIRLRSSQEVSYYSHCHSDGSERQCKVGTANYVARTESVGRWHRD